MTEGWYVLTIILAAVSFVAGYFLADHPRYVEKERPYYPLGKDCYCPGFFDRLDYQQWFKNRPLHELAAEGKELKEFLEKIKHAENRN